MAKSEPEEQKKYQIKMETGTKYMHDVNTRHSNMYYLYKHRNIKKITHKFSEQEEKFNL